MTLQPVDFKDQEVYQVSWVSVDEDYAGQGVGYELYRGLITLMNISLIQTTSHSTGARKLCARLSQDPKIRAWGFDCDDHLVFDVKPNASGKELTSCRRGIKIYKDDFIGLALVRRKSRIDKFFTALNEASMLRITKRKHNPWGIKRFTPLRKLG